jgi:hypothetical protein
MPWFSYCFFCRKIINARCFRRFFEGPFGVLDYPSDGWIDQLNERSWSSASPHPHSHTTKEGGRSGHGAHEATPLLTCRQRSTATQESRCCGAGWESERGGGRGWVGGGG